MTEKHPNYTTPSGLETLRSEYAELLNEERPKIVKVVEWAASNGDRSENADYIYGKKRLREIDKRLRQLGKWIEEAIVVKASDQKNRNKIFFGATVRLEDEEGVETTFQIVGEHETDVKNGRISWLSPLGKALLGKTLDQEVQVNRPAGRKTYTVLDIQYR